MKIKALIVGLMLVASTIGITTHAFAHGAGPHGGELVDIAPYHLEFQIGGGMVHLYIIDEKGKIVSAKGVTGKLIVQTPDGAKKDITLSTMGEALMANGVDDKSAFIAIATIQIQGKSYTARYSYDPSKKENKNAAADEGQKKLKGKIVDISCLLTHNSQGESHKQCARDCALKGLPFGILAEDGNIYQIIPIGHLDPKTVNQTLLDYLEESVVIDGSVFVKNGMRVVMIDKIAKL